MSTRTALRKNLLTTVVGLALGALVLPGLIYAVGIAALGQYEGASLAATYKVVLGGLARGSIASWVVVLGPFLLWYLGRLLLYWWRASARAF
jgi:hypothetical protein